LKDFLLEMFDQRLDDRRELLVDPVHRKEDALPNEDGHPRAALAERAADVQLRCHFARCTR